MRPASFPVFASRRSFDPRHPRRRGSVLAPGHTRAWAAGWALPLGSFVPSHCSCFRVVVHVQYWRDSHPPHLPSSPGAPHLSFLQRPDAGCLAERGFEDSRGLQPTVRVRREGVAERRLKWPALAGALLLPSSVVPRRACHCPADRGLKPTAIIRKSLRDCKKLRGARRPQRSAVQPALLLPISHREQCLIPFRLLPRLSQRLNHEHATSVGS